MKAARRALQQTSTRSRRRTHLRPDNAGSSAWPSTVVAPLSSLFAAALFVRGICSSSGGRDPFLKIHFPPSFQVLSPLPWFALRCKSRSPECKWRTTQTKSGSPLLVFRFHSLGRPFPAPHFISERFQFAWPGTGTQKAQTFMRIGFPASSLLILERPLWRLRDLPY